MPSMGACVQFLAWDQKARNHVSDFKAGSKGNQIEAHEYDYTVHDQLIFDEDNITVYSTPAFHYDTPGPTSLRLEWNGLSMSYSGGRLKKRFLASVHCCIHDMPACMRTHTHGKASSALLYAEKSNTSSAAKLTPMLKCM